MARQRRVPGDVRLETMPRTRGRGVREPAHNFRGLAIKQQTLKWSHTIPVLAGDTLKSASIMSRIIGAPTTTNAASITGQWFEQWLFYVRIGDLASAESFRAYVSSQASNPPVIRGARTEVRTAVYDNYFRDEGEPSYPSTSPLGVLRWVGQDWLDSATDQASLPPADTISGDWEDQWAKYQVMRRAKLTVNTFEEYLAKSGIAVPPQLRHEHDTEMKRPELIHYAREFAYPQPTTAPSGTTLAHAVQWFSQERVNRARFFAEPGFLVHAYAVRPKVILGPPDGNTASMPGAFYNWEESFFPTEFDTDPHTSLHKDIPGSIFSPSGDTIAGSGLLTTDVRDAYLYGWDEWEGAGAPTVQTPNRRPSLSQVNALPTFDIDIHMRFRILSRIHKDTTA